MLEPAKVLQGRFFLALARQMRDLSAHWQSSDRHTSVSVPSWKALAERVSLLRLTAQVIEEHFPDCSGNPRQASCHLDEDFSASLKLSPISFRLVQNCRVIGELQRDGSFLKQCRDDRLGPMRTSW